MADKIYPDGSGIIAVDAAGLNTNDFVFMGTSLAGAAQKTQYSELALAIVTPFDNVIYAYKDTDEITIAAGGKFTLADGTVKTFATDTDLSTSADLTTDDTLTADTWYYLWSNGTTTKFSDDGSAAPSDVSGGVRLRGGIAIYNDSGTLKIYPFTFDGRWYRYQTLIPVFSGTCPITSTQIDLSNLAPDDLSSVYLYVTSGSFASTANGIIYLSYDNRVFTAGIPGFRYMDGSMQTLVRWAGVIPLRQIFWFYGNLAIPTLTISLCAFQVCKQ